MMHLSGSESLQELSDQESEAFVGGLGPEVFPGKADQNPNLESYFWEGAPPAAGSYKGANSYRGSGTDMPSFERNPVDPGLPGAPGIYG